MKPQRQRTRKAWALYFEGSDIERPGLCDGKMVMDRTHELNIYGTKYEVSRRGK